jgi:hypothetical protein
MQPSRPRQRDDAVAALRQARGVSLPDAAVLRWPAEAHAYGAVEPYMASLLNEDPLVAPLDRLAREAVHGARTAMRGKRPELVDAAVRSALRETIFRFELVMCIYMTAKELLDREVLLDAALSAQVSLLVCEDLRTVRPTRRTPIASPHTVTCSHTGSAS